MFAAASLKEAFATIAGAFEAEHPGAHVVLNLAGSQELRAQIEQGAPADLFASADRNQIYPLAAAGLVEDPVSLTCNRPVVITATRADGDPDAGRPAARPADRAGRARGPDRSLHGGAARPRGAAVRARVPRPRPGAGRLARAQRAPGRREGRPRGSRRRASSTRRMPSPRAARCASWRSRRRVNVLAEYPVAVAHGAAHAALARAFLALLQGPIGARALNEAGFVPCPAP